MSWRAFTDALKTRELPDGGFRGDIEGLRGVAILLVVLYHVGFPGFSGGYIGVDVFFVLSGYLISGLLVREIESSGRVDFVRFYARRARRLLPAAILVVIATMAGSWFVYSPDEQTSLAATAFFSVAYASNLWFGYKSLDYLATDPATNPFLHTWSLSVEEQFYLLWPVLMLLASGALRGRVSRVRLVWVMLATGALSFAFSVALTLTVQPWAFFGSPLRAWEFAVGALAYLLPNTGAEDTRSSPGWLAILAILAASLLMTEQTLFPGIVALVPVVGTALVLRAGTAGDGSLFRVLSSGSLRYLGRVSYSWYLWHWPVLVLPVVEFGSFGLRGRVLLGLASLGLAELTYAFVENPVRRSRFLGGRPVWSLALAGALTFMAASTGAIWRLTSEAQARTPDQRRYTRAASDRDSLLATGCSLNYLDVEPSGCTLGSTDDSTTVVLLGDSHAGQWSSALEPIAKERGWRLAVAVKTECPVPSVEYFHSRLKRAYTECSRWRETILDSMESQKPYLVFASSSYAYVGQHGVSQQEWRKGLIHTLRRIVVTGSRVVLIRDTPRPGFHVPTCLGRALWPVFLAEPEACSFIRESNTELFEIEKEVSEAIPGVTVADFTNDICEESVCAPEVRGIVKFRDATHLTRTFAATLKDALKREISLLDGVRSVPVPSVIRVVPAKTPDASRRRD